VAPLERWLGELDPHDLLEAECVGAPPQARLLEFAGWRIRVEALPLKPEHRGEDGQGILGYTGEGIGEIDDVSPILRKLKRNAHHYGELDRPFVIALLCAGTFAEPQDIEAALFGPTSERTDRACRSNGCGSERACGCARTGRPTHESRGIDCDRPVDDGYHRR
jgi:hypothetical protein